MEKEFILIGITLLVMASSWDALPHLLGWGDEIVKARIPKWTHGEMYAGEDQYEL
ncbi:MAG: hypothetical protein WC238_00595 [Parcubacteria group bacterium]|jgi:hypothetical protein